MDIVLDILLFKYQHGIHKNRIVQFVQNYYLQDNRFDRRLEGFNSNIVDQKISI